MGILEKSKLTGRVTALLSSPSRDTGLEKTQSDRLDRTRLAEAGCRDASLQVGPQSEIREIHTILPIDGPVPSISCLNNSVREGNCLAARSG